jgi:hypothetical protein
MSARRSGLTITRACSRDTPSTPATLRASASSRVIGLRSRGTFGRASSATRCRVGYLTNPSRSPDTDWHCIGLFRLLVCFALVAHLSSANADPNLESKPEAALAGKIKCDDFSKKILKALGPADPSQKSGYAPLVVDV